MVDVRACLVICLTSLMLHLPSAAAERRPPSRDITKTPHNLSVSGGGGAHDVKSSQETRICIFCHTPHHATSSQPLWSREVSALTIYIPYASATLRSKPQQPRGPSRLCLSCHDGTIAMGLLAGGANLDQSMPVMPADVDPAKNPNLGTDLSNDHPISMSYLAETSSEFNSPALLQQQGVKLSEGTYVECTSCHDPHNNENGNFLVRNVSVQRDALCTTCHAKSGWSDPDSVHRSGGGRYPTVQPTVAASGCVSCHRPHTAEQAEHLLKRSPGEGEESTCLASCHRSSPYNDIWSEFNARTYTHPVKLSGSAHKANEPLPLRTERKHVECVDCHNPHQAGWRSAPLGASSPQLPPASKAPEIDGPLRGVRGVDQYGAAEVPAARNEYEICFRCHAGSAASDFIGISYLPPLRVFRQYDESQRFSQSNPSYHPITADRQGTGQSLLVEYQTTMYRIYCSDCHHPHGSNEPHLLRAQNWDVVPSPVVDYPLCFRCHDPNFLMNPMASPRSATVALHRNHVIGPHDNGATGRATCSACHDPHGVPLSTGANPVNAAHLINFDKRFAGPTPLFSAIDRSCSVACHSTNPRTY